LQKKVSRTLQSKKLKKKKLRIQKRGLLMISWKGNDQITTRIENLAKIKDLVGMTERMKESGREEIETETGMSDEERNERRKKEEQRDGDMSEQIMKSLKVRTSTGRRTNPTPSLNQLARRRGIEIERTDLVGLARENVDHPGTETDVRQEGDEIGQGREIARGITERENVKKLGVGRLLPTTMGNMAQQVKNFVMREAEIHVKEV
jgi:hypothetical protein